MFKIEVQADSIPQLADRLLALGAQLSPRNNEVSATATLRGHTAAEAEADYIPGVKSNTPEKRTRGANKPKVEPEVEVIVAEMVTAAAAGAAEERTESMADAVRDEPEAEAPEVQAEPESGIVAADLDFDKDVAPRVLDLVARKGREAMVKVLDEFGAARASEVDSAQWGELLAKLEEAAA